MRNNRSTNNAIGCMAMGLLAGFVISFIVTAASEGLAETCSTWVVLPVLALGLAVARGG